MAEEPTRERDSDPAEPRRDFARSDARPDSTQPSQRGPVRFWLPVGLAIVLGAFGGIGAYTFRYAEGLSYFSTDPRACVNCHIMQPQYDAWQKASHHTVAVCVDCHLPHALVPKYLAKAENGWRHGKLFTTQTFVEPIVVQAMGREILQDNCVRCHSALVDEMSGHGALPLEDGSDAPTCTHCHFTVGHGVRAGLGGPLRKRELPPDEPPSGKTKP